MAETAGAGFWTRLTWEGAVATIALVLPWLVALWRRVFRRGTVDLHETGTVEVGYSTFGPTIGLHGTLRGRYADVFVRAIRLELVRERDQARHLFDWVAFRSHRIVVGKAEETSLELPAGFMLLTSQPYRYNILFSDSDVRESVSTEVQIVQRVWFDAVLEDRSYDDFRTDPAHTDAFSKLGRLCYWEKGHYSLRATIETTRPDRSFTTRWRFELSEDEAESLRMNVLSMLRETCWQADVNYQFAYSKYLNAS